MTAGITPNTSVKAEFANMMEDNYIQQVLAKMAETRAVAIEKAWASKPHHCGVFHGGDKYEECIVLNRDEFFELGETLFLAGQREMRDRITNHTVNYDEVIKIETPETI